MPKMRDRSCSRRAQSLAYSAISEASRAVPAAKSAPVRGDEVKLGHCARGAYAFWGHVVQKIPMTAGGLTRLEDELRRLKSDDRPAVIRAIAEARAHGDLSENAEYHAARDRQSFIEGRILELEELISTAEVIDPSTLSGDQVKFGAHVEVVDEETDKESAYQIVGVHEADIKQGLLSISSPLAKSLIGKSVGDSVAVPTPGGDKTYEILTVTYK